MEYLIKTYTNEDTVLDATIDGTTGVAMEMWSFFVGIERDRVL